MAELTEAEMERIQEAAQLGVQLAESGDADAMKTVRRLYEVFGPFELGFDGEVPDWYEPTSD